MSRLQAWQESCDFEDSMISLLPSPSCREINLKLLVLGDVMVGKTSLVQRYVNNVFLPSYKETIGVDFTMKVINWSTNLTIKLQFWDIAGNERLGAMTRAYYRHADGCVIMFDVTDLSTFDRVSSWKEDLDSKCRLSNGSPVPCLLLGNKSDLSSEWSVKGDAMQSLIGRYGFCAWREISVKNNVGVDEALRFLIDHMLDHRGGQDRTDISTHTQRATGTTSVVLTPPPPSQPSPSSQRPCTC